jgi:hypothetical protein
MNDNPAQIADHLIEQHGVDGALNAVREGIGSAQADRDNYRLSVWRDVRRILRDRQIIPDDLESLIT